MAATDTLARVELHPLGFVVTVEGRPWPKSLPGRICIFDSRAHARSFAEAVDAADADRCHDLIATHGRWYTTEATSG